MAYQSPERTAGAPHVDAPSRRRGRRTLPGVACLMRTRSGFSLTELVVVVLVLAILAAVAAPRLLSFSSDATEAATLQSLRSVREAIDYYVLEHNGEYPAKAGTEASLKTDLRPYLKGPFPNCPVGAKNGQVRISTTGGGLGIVGEAAPTKGWHYHNKKGLFIINYTGVSDSGTPYDKL